MSAARSQNFEHCLPVCRDTELRDRNLHIVWRHSLISATTYLCEKRLRPNRLSSSREAYLILYTDASFFRDPGLENIQAIELVSARNRSGPFRYHLRGKGTRFGLQARTRMCDIHLKRHLPLVTLQLWKASWREK